MVYRRKRGGNKAAGPFYVAFLTRSGLEVKLSTGTPHRPTAKAIEDMLEVLRSRREWDLLDLLTSSHGEGRRPRLSLPALFDAYRFNDLDGLRARLDDVDLQAHVAGWQEWLRTRVRPDTREHYLAHVRSLMPEGQPFTRSMLTRSAVTTWLTTRTGLVQKRRKSVKRSQRKADPTPRPISGGTKLKYLAALRSFVGYLLDLGIFETDPTQGLKRPRQALPRCEFHPLADVLRIVEGSEQPWRALFALAYGAGIELGVLLALTESDFDQTRKAVRARGTKAHARDRVAYIAEWAWPFVKAHLDRLTPGERAFRGIDRWQVQDAHRERQRVCGLTQLRVHDARHHYAVEHLRAGVPVELVSRQLGHKDAVMVLRVYGRFIPHDLEWNHWREQVAARQAEALKQADSPKSGANSGATAEPISEDRKEESPATPWECEASESSWGRIRTADPGIMSAVL